MRTSPFSPLVSPFPHCPCSDEHVLLPGAHLAVAPRVCPSPRRVQQKYGLLARHMTASLCGELTLLGAAQRVVDAALGNHRRAGGVAARHPAAQGLAAGQGHRVPGGADPICTFLPVCIRSA